MNVLYWIFSFFFWLLLLLNKGKYRTSSAKIRGRNKYIPFKNESNGLRALPRSRYRIPIQITVHHIGH